jgi:hypothetical protein
MMGGMARVVSYDTPRTRRNGRPVSKIIEETDKWYSWMIDVASHTTV